MRRICDRQGQCGDEREYYNLRNITIYIFTEYLTTTQIILKLIHIYNTYLHKIDPQQYSYKLIKLLYQIFININILYIIKFINK